MTVQPIQPGPATAPSFLRLASLSDDEERQRQRLAAQLGTFKAANARQEEYYEGARVVRDLGIAIPPHLKDLEAVAGWPEIVVDVVNERLEWRGWGSTGPDLTSVYAGNHLDVEVSQATLDALICGVSFLSAGAGGDGEPDVLVKAESPSRVTGVWDSRLRRLTSAISEDATDHLGATGWTLDFLNERIVTRMVGGRLVVVDRDQHGLNRVPVVALLNRPRASRHGGRSEITRAVRSYTDSAMRTLLGMEVAREFYAAPQRWIMGADESMFTDEAGNRVDQWKAIIGRVLALPRGEEADVNPEVGEFKSASPQPFTEVLKTYSQMVSASTGIPATHLGFATDNPASAEAIQRADGRLDKRAMLRQSQYDLGLVELGNVCSLWSDGTLPAPGSVRSRWVPVSLVSPGAAADRATKAIAAGVLDPSWDITARQFGFTDDEVDEIRRERRRSGGSAALRQVAGRVASNVPPLALPEA